MRNKLWMIYLTPVSKRIANLSHVKIEVDKLHLTHYAAIITKIGMANRMMPPTMTMANSIFFLVSKLIVAPVLTVVDRVGDDPTT